MRGTPCAWFGIAGQMMDAQPKWDQSDTSPEARRVLYDLYRRMPPARKFQLICDTYDLGKQLALAGLRMRHPNAAEDELRRLWSQEHLGRELFEKVYGRSTRE